MAVAFSDISENSDKEEEELPQPFSFKFQWSDYTLNQDSP